MSKTETREGREAWAFICRIVCPLLPPGATKTEIKGLAYVVFRVGDDWPPGRIDEAAQRRCKAPTKEAIENRARELGIATPAPSPWKQDTPADEPEDTDVLTNLLSAQATIYARHKDTSHPEFIAISEAIKRLG